MYLLLTSNKFWCQQTSHTAKVIPYHQLDIYYSITEKRCQVNEDHTLPLLYIILHCLLIQILQVNTP